MLFQVCNQLMGLSR